MKDFHEIPTKNPEEERYRDPYEQDLQNFPEFFQIYNRNYQYYEEQSKRFAESKNEEMEVVDRSEKKEPKNTDPWNRKF
jgi:hypothetical protein